MGGSFGASETPLLLSFTHTTNIETCTIAFFGSKLVLVEDRVRAGNTVR